MINNIQQAHKTPFAGYRPQRVEYPSKAYGLQEGTKKEEILNIQKFRNSFFNAQGMFQSEKKINHGIKTHFECSVREVMMKNKPEETENPGNEMLKKLRDMFDIPVLVIGSEEDDIPHRLKLGLGAGNFRMFRISEEMLKRMAEDPELFQDVTERMKQWRDGTCEFLRKHEGTISSMEMYICETGFAYAYTENFDAPDFFVKNAKVALNDLHDFLLKWLGERNKDSNEIKTDEKVTTAEDTSEHLIEKIMSK